MKWHSLGLHCNNLSYKMSNFTSLGDLRYPIKPRNHIAIVDSSNQDQPPVLRSYQSKDNQYYGNLCGKPSLVR